MTGGRGCGAGTAGRAARLLRGLLFLVSMPMAAAVMSLGGCGGGLKYTVDDAALAPAPAGDRQGVEEARKEVEAAEAEGRDAETVLLELAEESQLAAQERDQAQLEIEKTVAEQEGAKASRDENQANAAAHNKDLADLGLKVAKAKLDWLNQKQTWLKQTRSAAQAHLETARARVEFEKAKVANRMAQEKGTKPSPDVEPARYEGQWMSKKASWQSEQEEAASKEKGAREKEQQWKDLSIRYRMLKGG